jgi:hypothetical protein
LQRSISVAALTESVLAVRKTFNRLSSWLNEVKGLRINNSERKNNIDPLRR